MLGCFVVATSFVWTFHWSSLVATACPVHKMICRAQHFIFCVLILVWFWFFVSFGKNCSDFFWFLNFDFCFSLELDSWSLIFYWFCALKFSKLFILILVPKKSSMLRGVERTIFMPYSWRMRCSQTTFLIIFFAISRLGFSK